MNSALQGVPVRYLSLHFDTTTRCHIKISRILLKTDGRVIPRSLCGSKGHVSLPLKSGTCTPMRQQLGTYSESLIILHKVETVVTIDTPAKHMCSADTSSNLEALPLINLVIALAMSSGEKGVIKKLSSLL